MITRFAPSPTGPLHLGHAYAAYYAHDLARRSGGHFLLRIEDIDQSRSRLSWEKQIYEDLNWLGLAWDEPVIRQSDRLKSYAEAIEKLNSFGILYPCKCNRKDIQNALSAPQEGVSISYGPDGPVYPGTCRNNATRLKVANPDIALRLNMRNALERIDIAALQYIEKGHGSAHEVSFNAQELLESVGDVVISRRDMGTSYHLSVVLDDAYQGITDVTRGEDLRDATKIHVLLQKLLNLPTPTYHHHRLIRDSNGKRLAKRDDARAIAKYRKDGLSPADVRKLIRF